MSSSETTLERPVLPPAIAVSETAYIFSPLGVPLRAGMVNLAGPMLYDSPGSAAITSALIWPGVVLPSFITAPGTVMLLVVQNILPSSAWNLETIRFWGWEE